MIYINSATNRARYSPDVLGGVREHLLKINDDSNVKLRAGIAAMSNSHIFKPNATPINSCLRKRAKLLTNYRNSRNVNKEWPGVTSLGSKVK